MCPPSDDFYETLDIADILNPEDFSSVEVIITATNVTTKMDFKKTVPITVSEFNESGLIIGGPVASCSAGHSLLMHFDIQTPNKKNNFAFDLTARVLGVERTSDTNDRILLELVQYEEKDWKAYMDLFSNRQQQIDDFFQAAKGF